MANSQTNAQTAAQESAPVEVSIGGGQKLRIESVRVCGDVIDADGNAIERGHFIELDAAQVSALGEENIQGIADVWKMNNEQ